MKFVIPNNYKLPRVVKVLRGYLHISNYTYNETDFQILIRYINDSNSYKHGENYSVFKYGENNSVYNCGERVKVLAEIYAKKYHSYLAITVCLFGIIANLLNVIVLSRKEMICAPINRILSALAVTDILVMAEYIPYACYYYMVLPKNLDFPYGGAIYMLLHVHFTQTLHTTSICLTLMLAIWRYLALGYPTRQHVFCSQLRCTLGMTACYILPIILCLPTYATISITSQEIIENKTEYTLYHTDLSDTFRTDKTLLRLNFWIYGVFIKLLPCCILTVISFWLIRTLFLAKKRKQVLRSYEFYVLNQGRNGPRMKMERRAERTTKMLVAVLVLFLVTEFPQGIFAFMIGIKGKDMFLECYQLYGEFMDILALFSGAVNFILYCFMNRMYRMTFGKIFKNRIFNWLDSCMVGARERERVSQIQETET